jgi:phospholipid-binding lipoprotein MlaA|tara:strand:- start:502 stop:1194 length:693 start_codon:yes stop_codon:yes gene_type:complete
MIKPFFIKLILLLLLSPFTFAEVDPFQNINEKTHNLNQTLDLQVASPVARFYKRITPDFLEKGITNFTHNIEDLSIGINNILQGKFNEGLSDFSRFTLNTSIGLLGFIDIASDLGLTKHDEDFGQTLAVWGVPDGPYLVLPGLGPSTTRDTLAMIPDAFLTPLWLIDHDRTSYSLTAIDLIDTRARYLGLESVVIGDEYLFYRDAYLQSRNFEIKDGEVEDDFDDFDDFN